MQDHVADGLMGLDSKCAKPISRKVDCAISAWVSGTKVASDHWRNRPSVHSLILSLLIGPKHVAEKAIFFFCCIECCSKFGQIRWFLLQLRQMRYRKAHSMRISNSESSIAFLADLVVARNQPIRITVGIFTRNNINLRSSIRDLRSDSGLVPHKGSASCSAEMFSSGHPFSIFVPLTQVDIFGE